MLQVDNFTYMDITLFSILGIHTNAFLSYQEGIFVMFRPRCFSYLYLRELQQTKFTAALFQGVSI